MINHVLDVVTRDARAQTQEKNPLMRRSILDSDQVLVLLLFPFSQCWTVGSGQSTAHQRGWHGKSSDPYTQCMDAPYSVQ